MARLFDAKERIAEVRARQREGGSLEAKYAAAVIERNYLRELLEQFVTQTDIASELTYDGDRYCTYCDDVKPQHDPDCIVSRARAALEDR